MSSHVHKFVVAVSMLLLSSGLEAKHKKPPPPPPPPPPPIIVYIPPRPTPPLGASPLFKVPQMGLNGARQTINTQIAPLQAVWNLRSAYNVAALDCLRPEHAEILVGYKRFLKIYKVGLLKANRAVDADYSKRYGTAFIRPREAYMTQVYNYYAFPPTLPNFCDAALTMARESMTLKPLDLTAFAQRFVPQFDLVYENFYRSYDQYKADAAAWDAKYAPVLVVVPVLEPTAPPTSPVTSVAVPSTITITTPTPTPSPTTKPLPTPGGR